MAEEVLSVQHLTEEAERGKRLLDKLDLPEAEDIFRNILQRVPAYRSSEPADKLIVSSLYGLAEIHSKHCRNVSGDKELDWLCGMFFALLFYKTSSEVCVKVIRHRRLNGTQSRGNGRGRGEAGEKSEPSSDAAYFSDMMSVSKSKMNATEVALLSALKGRVIERCMPCSRLSARRKTEFDQTWLEILWDFCARSAAEYQRDFSQILTEAEKDEEGSKTETISRTRRQSYGKIRSNSANLPQSPSDFQKDCSSPASNSLLPVTKGKMNFDRFQEAIKHFVSEVSHDIRNKYMNISGKIPHGLIEKRVCSELALRLTPGNEDSQEMQNIFNELLVEENGMSVDALESLEEDLEAPSDIGYDELSSDEDDDVNLETINLHVKPSAAYSVLRVNHLNHDRPCTDLVLHENGPSLSRSATAPNLPVCRRGTMAEDKNTNKTKPTSDLVEVKANKYMKSVVSFRSNRDGILTKWQKGNVGKPPATECNLPWQLGSFEEVSQFTEKKERPSSSGDSSEDGLQKFINESRLSQLLGHTAIKVADSFRKEMRFIEACQVYKYAYGIFTGYPVAGGQKELLARLLVDIGSTCSSAGELEAGSQLMVQAAGLYDVLNEGIQEADVWYQLGNTYLADNLRTESLLARIMQLTKDEVQKTDENADHDNQTDGSSVLSTDEDEDNSDDTYCTCIYEAITCYKRALASLDSTMASGRGQDADLQAGILSNLADCYIMTGNLDLAETCYEEALRLFTGTYGTSLLQKNAHVVCILGTLSFLTRNVVRAATMYETSHVLRQHLLDTDEPTLEMAWELSMLGMCYWCLGHYHKCVTWCVRAFKLYTRFFRGRIFFVDPLNRWFIVQNLYILGFAYITLKLYKKALHYLSFCKTMALEAAVEEQDVDQLIKILLTLGDAHAALGEEENAMKFYCQAKEQVELPLKNGIKVTTLRDEVEIRLMCGMSGTVPPELNSTFDLGLNHDHAVFHQREVESSIKKNMVAILLKLGLSENFEKDIDRAISRYEECVQGYRDIQESHEAARALSNIGTLCHVKGRMHDQFKEKQTFLKKAEKYLNEAYSLVDSMSPVCIHLGTFLYREGRFSDALLVLLPFIFCLRPEDIEISYSGIEQMVLPEHLHHFIEEEETLVLEARVLAKFLGILCFQNLKMTRDADNVLVDLYRVVHQTTKPVNYSLLGFGLLESRLFQEAAEVFLLSSRMQPESDLAYNTAWISILMAAYATMAKGLDCILHLVLCQLKADRSELTFHEKKSYLRRQTSVKARLVAKSKLEQNPFENNKVDVFLASGRSTSTVVPYHQTTTPQKNPVTVEPRTEVSLRERPTSVYGDPRQNVSRTACTSTREFWNKKTTEIEPKSLQAGEAENNHLVRQNLLQDSGVREEMMSDESSSRKKWRSRLYHGLPEVSGSELLTTDPSRQRPVINVNDNNRH